MTNKPTARIHEITIHGVTSGLATCVDCQHVGVIDLSRQSPGLNFGVLSKRLRRS